MKSRVVVAAAVLAVAAACAAAFVAGRGSVDRTPPQLPAARAATLLAPHVSPAIVMPPRAVVP
jgi:hypothetical protein